ncbi:hypothetical protein Hanom_Chr07g00657381 [Helianthus anomalus]
MAIWAPVKMQSSLAFLKRPARRLEKVTRRVFCGSIFLISIFLRPCDVFLFVIVVVIMVVGMLFILYYG